MVTFNYVSDLHTDFWTTAGRALGDGAYYPWEDERTSDILVVGGDCGNDPIRTKMVLSEARRFFSRVIFVDGNHEHYVGRTHKYCDVPFNCDVLSDFRGPEGFSYLDGYTSVVIDDVAFIGANAWYDFRAYPYASREQQHAWWKRDSNDSRCIRFGYEGYPDKLARQQADLIATEARKHRDDPAVRAIVCITHTVPIDRALMADLTYAYLNGAYRNTLVWDMVKDAAGDKLAVWCYGHTHCRDDFDHDGVRFINNARGYPRERRVSRLPYEGLKHVEV